MFLHPRRISPGRQAHCRGHEHCRRRGFLGDRVLGSDFHLHLAIKEGAGAFVCGEETALMASIEGRRGMPRLRPPFPAESRIVG